MEKVKIAVIGAGVGGMSAAIYALRANADVTVFEQAGVGGLTATIDKIENYPALGVVEGWELADKMAKHATSLGMQTTREKVLSVLPQEGNFVLKTNKSEYIFNAVVVATGTRHNKLGVEDAYVGKGVSYCATCDGNFFRNKPVVVAGSGNQAVKEALYLAGICKTVYFVAAEEIEAEQVNLDLLASFDNVRFLQGWVTELSGEERLEKVVVATKDSQKTTLEANALFVAVGSKPSLDFLQDVDVERVNGFLKVDDRSQTSLTGLFAAGDCTSGPLKQIVTACGDGAKAGTFAVAYAKAQLKKASK